MSKQKVTALVGRIFRRHVGMQRRMTSGAAYNVKVTALCHTYPWSGHPAVFHKENAKTNDLSMSVDRLPTSELTLQEDGKKE